MTAEPYGLAGLLWDLAQAVGIVVLFGFTFAGAAFIVGLFMRGSKAR